MSESPKSAETRSSTSSENDGEVHNEIETSSISVKTQNSDGERDDQHGVMPDHPPVPYTVRTGSAPLAPYTETTGSAPPVQYPAAVPPLPRVQYPDVIPPDEPIAHQCDYRCFFVDSKQFRNAERVLRKVAAEQTPLKPSDMEHLTDDERKALSVLNENNSFCRMCNALSIRNFQSLLQPLLMQCLSASRKMPQEQRSVFFAPVYGLYNNPEWPQFREGEELACRSFLRVFLSYSEAEKFLEVERAIYGTIFTLEAKKDEKLTAYRISDDKRAPLLMQPDLFGKVTGVDHSGVTLKMKAGVLPLFEDVFPTRDGERMCQAAKDMMATAKTEKEKKQAYSLLCKADEFGSKYAAFLKAKCMFEGFGTTQDQEFGEKAMKEAILRMTPNKNNCDAFLFVGDLYRKAPPENPKGSKERSKKVEDLEQAKKYFEQIAEDNMEARNRIKMANELIRKYKRGTGTVLDPRSVVITPTDVVALVNEGLRYYYGDGVLVDHLKAADLFRQAGEAGSLEGMNNYAICLIEGIGVRQNVTLAVQFLEESSRGGYMIASINLAHCIATEKRQPSSEGEAYDLLERCHDSPEAHLLLGLLYVSSSPNPRTIDTAKEHFRLAKLGDKRTNEIARLNLRVLNHMFSRVFENKKLTKVENFPWLLSEKL